MFHTIDVIKFVNESSWLGLWRQNPGPDPDYSPVFRHYARADSACATQQGKR